MFMGLKDIILPYLLLFSQQVVSSSSQLHGLQHTRLPCLSPSPGDCPSSCPLNRWWHPAISSSVILFSFCLQSFPVSVFSNESALCIRWPKYWSFSLSISLSSEYSGLISFRIDWIDFLAAQGTFKSLLQHHNSKAQFFGIQPFLWSNSHIRTWLLETPQLWLHGPL